MENFTQEAGTQSPASGATAGPGANRQLGTDLRALRRSRRETLASLAARLGRSIGWLSQVERGISQPSLEDLRLLAAAFSVPLSFFFAHQPRDEAEQGVVVRAGHRRSLGTSETGLIEELLSPDLGGSFEMLRSEFASGAELLTPALRSTEEAGYVVSGRFDIEIDGVWYRLSAGDSFRFREKPFRWRNPGSEPAVVVWVVSPPVY